MNKLLGIAANQKEEKTMKTVEEITMTALEVTELVEAVGIDMAWEIVGHMHKGFNLETNMTKVADCWHRGELTAKEVTELDTDGRWVIMNVAAWELVKRYDFRMIQRKRVAVVEDMGAPFVFLASENDVTKNSSPYTFYSPKIIGSRSYLNISTGCGPDSFTGYTVTR